MERPLFSRYRTLCFQVMMAFFLVMAPAAALAVSFFEGVTVAEKYEPGAGVPVAAVVLVEGAVVVIHAETPAVGYEALSAMPLYKGDTLMTGPDGKVSFQTKDDSLITLSTDTRLVITESIYETGGDGGGDRATFVRQIFGKTRFFIRKLMGFSRSEFKVKTRTAIVGVRGSDFVVQSTNEQTQVFAFEDTRLDIAGVVAPCPECLIVPKMASDFSRFIVEAGGQPMNAGEMIPNEADLLKMEFVIHEDDTDRRFPREHDFERNFLTSDRNRLEEPPRFDPTAELNRPELERGADPRFAPSPSESPDRPAEDLGEMIREEELRLLPDFPTDPDTHVPDGQG